MLQLVTLFSNLYQKDPSKLLRLGDVWWAEGICGRFEVWTVPVGDGVFNNPFLIFNTILPPERLSKNHEISIN